MPLLLTTEQNAKDSKLDSKYVSKHIGETLNSPIKSKKAKRIRFFANGDKFSKGVIIAVTPERYRSYDSLLNELTRSLSNNVNLSTGVRVVYSLDGHKISCLNEFEDGKSYVCSGLGENFKRIDYTLPRTNPKGVSKLKPARSFTKLTSSQNFQCKTNEPVRPKILIIVRNGNRPRKSFRLLVSKRNAPSFDHALSSITELVKLDTGAVRKLFAVNGTQITSLNEFFESEDILFAYGSERVGSDDFELDFEELKSIQSLKKGLRKNNGELKSGTHCIDQNGTGIPKLPNKTKAIKVQKQTDSSSNISTKVLNKYTVGQIIGDGNFAVVRKCVDKVKAIEYALKIIDKSKCVGKEQMIENEVAILRTVRHKNIIQLLAEYDTPNELYLVMELIKGGDLFDAISRAVKFPESEARIMTHDLASALAYLHEQSIVHRDIKPENLLVEMEGARLKTLKVGDFGLAQKVYEPLNTVCGTPTYVAPEILTETGYGLEIDVWAMGVILYIMLCGFPPFVSANNDQEELFDDILSGQYGFPSPYWDQVSDQAKDLISHMLQSNPQLRFTAEDVLDHSWFEIDK